MSIRRIAVLAGFVLAAAPLGAQEAEAPVVAVVDFNAFSLSPGDDAASVGRGLATMISNELASRPEVQVVDRQQIDDLIAKRQLAVSGRMEDDAAVRLGQLLGAQYIVVGNVALEPERARIDLRLLDVATGAVERGTRRTSGRDDFLALVSDVADEFARDLELPTRAAAAAVQEAPAAAILAYSRGLDYENRGMAGRAEAMYRRALELHPDHEAARTALDRVAGGGE